MSLAASVTELIGHIYDAAVDPWLWGGVLDRTRDLMSANGAALLTDAFREPEAVGNYHYDSRMDRDLLKRYERECRLDPNKNSAYKFYTSFPIVKTVLRTDFVSDAEYYASEQYQRWMRPLGIFNVAVTKLFEQDGTFVFFNLTRSRDQGNFAPGELALLSVLAPHLRRAVTMQQRFALAEAERAGFDRLPWGIVFVDGEGRLLSHNEAAAAILAAADGLALHRGRLHAATPPLTARLLTTIRQAALAASGEVPPPSALALPRPSRRRALHVLVAPVRGGSARPGLAPPAVVLFVSDPEQRIVPSDVALRRLFGLTRAEARLAAVLADCDRLADAAERLGISLSTAKTQLQAIFAKTGTRRQAHLVDVLLRTPAIWRVGGAR